MSLQVRLLGGFELERDGQVLCGLPTRKTQALLAYLIYYRDRLHTREALIGRFWPGVGGAKAYGNLRQALYQIRKKLGPEAMLARSAAVAVNTAFECTCDAHDFLRFLEDAEAASPHESGRFLEEAVALYRGPFLEGCYEDWAVSEAERLRDLYSQALHQLVLCHKRFGRYKRALGYAHHALQLVPLREELHRELMELHAALGQRSTALQQYETCTKLLAEELGLEPQVETVELYERICSGTTIELERFVPHNLPRQTTSFVGRERELEEVRALLKESCLLTLTGVGGVGKSRLALQAASADMQAFPDGVWWVDLSVLDDPTLIPGEIEAALGLREHQGEERLKALAADLGEMRLLLILDNCEGLVEAAATVAGRLQRGCQGMRILATSREVLRAEGETVYTVPPMEVEARERMPTSDSTGTSAPSDAVQLFVARARASDPSFRLHKESERTVSSICKELDGLPLAIELAAARVRSLSPEQIVARLDDRFKLLTAGNRTALPRHRTLRATLDWSYELLSKGEQALLQRLTVFWGGWTLAAAKAVCADQKLEEGSIRDCLANLVDKSMVLFVQGTSPRYRMLDTVWYHAAERLAETGGDIERFRTRHVQFFLQMAEGTSGAFRGALTCETTDPPWVEVWELELDNFRGAMRWALEHGRADTAMRIATGLEPLWHDRARVQEALTWYAQGFRMRSSLSRPTLGRVLVIQGHTLAQQGATDALTEAYVRAGLALCRECTDLFCVGLACRALGFLASNRGELEAAHTRFTASLETFKRSEDALFLAYVHADLGEISAAQGAFRQARGHMEESVRLLQGYRRLARRNAVLCLARLAFTEGDLEAAEAHITEALNLGHPDEHTPAMARILLTRAEIAAEQSDLSSAEHHVNEALARAEGLNLPLTQARGLHVLARLAIAHADRPSAWAYINAALGILSRHESVRDLPALLETAAQLLLDSHSPERSAQLLGAVERLRETVHAPRPPCCEKEHRYLVTSTQDALGDAAFKHHCAQGHRLSAVEAIGLVSPDDPSDSPHAHTPIEHGRT